MATYLQGVTDFIPDYQPFQPDLNFYANVLQTKQSQYDNNWKQLNNLYGQLYGADLTNDLNVQKKDQLLKQIDFNLKRVSGLDLSLEENVTQATQVFKPFYEDKYLMKDMAWTKNWKNTYESANTLKTSQDVKQRNQWWGTGVQGLELRRQMFKDATLDETLNMGNVTYTPNVQISKEFMELAAKYKVNKIHEAPDPSGLYMVRKKNGDIVLPTLQEMFLAEYTQRPDMQDKFREEAFVERMNYAYQNKEKFGSTLEAEKDYIKKKYDYIKTYASAKNNEAKDQLSTTENLMASVEKDVNNGNVKPQQNNYGKSLTELFSVNTAIEKNASDLNNQVNDNTKSSVDDILADIELARLKVDAGFASIAAEQVIIQSARDYADLNSEYIVKANPVGLEFLRNTHAQQRQKRSHEDRLDEIQAQSEAKMFEKAVDHNVGKGIWSFDENGKLNKNPQANGFDLNMLFANDAGGNTEGKFTFDDLQKMSKNQMADGIVESGNHLMKTIANGVNSDTFTSAQLAQFLDKFSLNKNDRVLVQNVLKNGTTKANKVEMQKIWGTIWNSYSSNPNEVIKTLSNSSQLYSLNNMLKSWTIKHPVHNLTELYNEGDNATLLDQAGRSSDAMSIIERNNNSIIRKKFSEDINYIVSQVKAKDPESYGNINNAKIEKAIDLVMNRYLLQGNGHLEEFKKLAPELDKQVGAILGFNIGKNTNQKAESLDSWYNYVFPLTNIPTIADNIFGDGRENVSDPASWIADVFDQSFEDLNKRKPTDGGLVPFFVNARSSGTGNEYGIASEQSIMKVAPGVPWSFANQATQSMLNTLLATQWNNDLEKYRITTEGNILPENLKADTGITTTEALAIARVMQGKLNTDAKLEPFFIGSSAIAMESEKLGSMKLMAPRSVIEEVIKSMSGEDTDDAKVKAKIDKIYQNGITFIAPKQLWEGNQLFQKQYATPTEVILREGPIKYEHPNGAGQYVIQKSPGGGDYISNIQAYELMPDGSKKTIEPYDWSHDVRSGKTVDAKEIENTNMLNAINAINFERYRQIINSGDPRKIEKAQQNFGGLAASPYWKYNF